VKTKLVRPTGIPVGDQELVYQNEALADDNEKLYQGTFQDKVARQLRSQKTQVFINDFEGKHIVTYYFPNETFLDFKNRISDHTAVPVHEQRLVVAGKPMQGDDTLMKSFEFAKDTTIHMVGRLRGGSE
jgi:hypothetical protein